MTKNSPSSAEERFRHAFERLKAGKPLKLAAGTLVSQNNVAKEAGCDPTALRKARFPSLVREIQAYVEITSQEQPSKRKEVLKQRAQRMGLKEQLAAVALQRDLAQSKLVSAQRRIVELAAELKSLQDRFNSLHPQAVPLRR